MVSGGPAPVRPDCVKPTDSVLHVRRVMESALNDPWLRVDLRYRGQKMEDGRNFESYQLRDGDTVRVRISNTDPWLLALQNPNRSQRTTVLEWLSGSTALDSCMTDLCASV